MNLELEKEYGKQVWTSHLLQTEQALAFTQGLNQERAQQIEEVNKKRRFSQMNEYDTFFRLHSKAHGLITKNVELEKECLTMEAQIAAYQQELDAIAVSALDTNK